MSRAEKFIQEHTRNCSNEFEPQKAPPSVYNPWLTPDDARKAVKIAQEEMIEWLRNHIRNYAFMVTDEFEGDIDVDTAINDLKQAIKKS